MTRSAPSPRAVIFDLGGVLLTGYAWPPFRAQWAQRLGLAPEWLDQHMWYGPDVEAANIGAITAEEYCRRSAQRLGCDAGEIQALIEEVFSGDRLDRALVEYIQTLRRRQIRVGALTNNWSFIRRLLVRRGIADLFDAIVASAEEGIAKPDPRIYQITCERLGVAPAEAVFVDDDAKNVEGARAVGMHAIHFRATEQALSELDALLRTGER